MTVRFPVTAISSILHRITGVVLFFAIPLLICALQHSLSSAEDFVELKYALNNDFLHQLVLWGILASLAFHIIAGLRHLLMDMGIGESLEGGTRGAWIVIILSVVAAAALGVWVW